MDYLEHYYPLTYKIEEANRRNEMKYFFVVMLIAIPVGHFIIYFLNTDLVSQYH